MKGNIMVKVFIIVLTLNVAHISFAQNEYAQLREQDIQEMRVDKQFDSKYRRKLRLLKRTYPMALKAKELVDGYERDLQSIEKKRKQKKYGKKAHAELKDEFTFNIKDLYQSEGRMLMKLIHRETGLTTAEIIEKYRGGFQETISSGLAKMWGNDLDLEYDVNKDDDWITELIIQDIQAGHIQFDTEMEKMEKADYKASMKEYRTKVKESKKRIRAAKRKKRRSKK